VGSFLCSLAGTIDILIAFRVLQGTGAGFLMPVGMAIITREFPPEKRGIALGFWTVAASASVSLGPTIGGYLIDRFEWNTIFDVNVPVGVFGLAAAAVILREHRPARGESFDVLGFLSLTAGLTALLLALSDGNSAWNTGGWSSNFILACFFIAMVCLGLFFITEFNVEHPLIRVKLFENYNFAMSNLVLFIFGLGVFGSNFLVPIYLQNLLDYTPLQSGLVFLPVGLIQAIIAPLAGMFADRHDPRVPAAVGLGLLALTFHQFSFLSLYSEKTQILVPLFIRGAAIGMLFSPLTIIAISEIPNRQIAQASGLINVIRQVGGSFGVAIFGTIMVRRTVFHSAIYGSAVNPYSATYRHRVAVLQRFAERTGGGTLSHAGLQAKALLMSAVNRQAAVGAIDDIFVLATIIVAIAVLPVLLLRSHRDGPRDRSALVD